MRMPRGAYGFRGFRERERRAPYGLPKKNFTTDTAPLFVHSICTRALLWFRDVRARP